MISSLPGRRSQTPSAPDSGAEDDEDDGEAEHEQQRARAASGRGGCRPHRRRGRRRTARWRRRGSPAAAGSRTGRRTRPARRPGPPGREQQRAGRAAWLWNQSPIRGPRRARPRPRRRSVVLRRDLAADAAPRPGPRGRGPRCSGSASGRQRAAERAAAPRCPGRRSRGTSMPKLALEAPRRCSASRSRMLMPTNCARVAELVGGVDEHRRLGAARARTTTPTR